MTALPTTNGTVLSKGIPSIYGRFWYFFRFTGVDLTRCSTHQKDVNKIEKGFRIGIMIAIIILFILYAIKFMNIKAKITDPIWGDANFNACFCVYAILSAIFLATWSGKGQFKQFEVQLRNLKNKRVQSLEYLDDYKKFYIKAIVFTLIYLVFTMIFSFKGILFQIAVQKSNVTNQDSVQNALKWTILDPFVFSYMSIICSYATFFFAVSNCSLAREAKYFNKELKEALENKQFYTSNGIRAFNSRHLELIKTIQLLNEFFGKMAGGAGFITGFIMFDTTLMNTGFSNQLTGFYKFVLFLGSIVFTGILVCILFPPSKIQHQLDETKNILLNDEVLSTDNQSREVKDGVKSIVDRIRFTNTKVWIIECIPIGSHSPHLFLFVLPMLGSTFGVVINALN